MAYSDRETNALISEHPFLPSAGSPGPTPLPGSLTVTGERRNNNRINSLAAEVTDNNGVSRINSVRFRILRADRTQRFEHTDYLLQTGLPANVVQIEAQNVPNNFRAGANNILEVEVQYTDPTGDFTVVDEAAFTTA